MSGIDCPRCKRHFNQVPCEQSVAIQKRGMCIMCLVQTGQSFCVEPYEFSFEGEELTDEERKQKAEQAKV